eukprot:gene17157-6154_t
MWVTAPPVQLRAFAYAECTPPDAADASFVDRFGAVFGAAPHRPFAQWA